MKDAAEQMALDWRRRMFELLNDETMELPSPAQLAMIAATFGKIEDGEKPIRPAKAKAVRPEEVKPISREEAVRKAMWLYLSALDFHKSFSTSGAGMRAAFLNDEELMA